jgi:hypothetical protein
MCAKAETRAGPATALRSLQGEPLGKPSFVSLSSLVTCYAATIAAMALEKDRPV